MEREMTVSEIIAEAAKDKGWTVDGAGYIRRQGRGGLEECPMEAVQRRLGFRSNLYFATDTTSNTVMMAADNDAGCGRRVAITRERMLKAFGLSEIKRGKRNAEG